MCVPPCPSYITDTSQDDLLLHESNFVDGFERSINVTLPSSVLNNGTYNAHVFVCRGGHNPLTAAENACVRLLPLTDRSN